jgi:hypothetical protein
MEDSKRLCEKDAHTASDVASTPLTVSIIDNASKSLDASLIQDPVQILELELIHTVPKDPIIETIFRRFNTHVPDKTVASYLKLNFIKLAAVHTMKESEKQEADIILAVQNLAIDRALAQKHKRVRKSSAFKLQQFIRDSGVQVPKVYQRMNIDDLCAVWHAINSDRHYSCSENLDPCHSFEFRVHVITHLHLIGGTPSHHQMLKKPKHTTYQQFLTLLPDFLSMARCNQTGRLGYSNKAPATGPWLYQYAASLEVLATDSWKVLCEETYDVMRRGTDQVVFLVHVSYSISSSTVTGSSLYAIEMHDLFEKRTLSTESRRSGRFLWIVLRVSHTSCIFRATSKYKCSLRVWEEDMGTLVTYTAS